MRRISISRSGARWRFRITVACIAALCPILLLAQTGALEYAVKVSYLFKFAPFVEWPEGSFGSPSDPLLLCVVGTDPVTSLVDDAAKSQGAAGRGVIVRRISAQAARDSRCHILYVASGQPDSVARTLDAVRGLPVLTITDAAPDDRSKGIVNLIVQDGRVRFETDLQSAAENGLVISSKLLELAAKVRARA